MIRLVTISRISKEKGFERMLKLELMLRVFGVPFIWDCYGDHTTAHAKQIIPRFRYVKFKGVTDRPLDVMKQYDYLVQLSDTEGFPYSIYEAMSQKVPVIATDFPSIHEMITDGVNGYILKMDLSNFDAEKIKSIPVIRSFREKSNEKDWIKFLDMTKRKTATAKSHRRTTAQGATQAKATEGIKNESPQGEVTHITGQGEAGNAITATTQETKKPTAKTVAVVVTRKYHDTLLDKVLHLGDRHEVSEKRAEALEKAGVARIIENT